MLKKIKYSIYILICSIALIYFYTLLHESGHALIAILNGGKIDDFVLGLNAHVKTSGAKFTIFSEALFHVAGALLPVLFIIFALIYYKTTVKNVIYHLIYFYIWVTITASLFAWIIIPLSSLFTVPPSNDDATKFLNTTGIHPIIISLIALLIITLLIVLVYKKGMLGKIKEVITNVFKIKIGKIIWVIAIWLGIITIMVIVFLFSNSSFKTSFTMEVNHNTEDVKVPFELTKSKQYTMDLNLGTKGFLTDIQIYNEQGIQVYQTICEWFTLNTLLDLEKGNYVLVLSFLQDAVEMREHIKTMGYTLEPDLIDSLDDLYLTNNKIENVPVTFSASIN